MKPQHPLWCLGVCLGTLAWAQPTLHLKQGPALELEWSGSAPISKRRSPSRSHLILQFERQPEPEQVGELIRRGIQVVGYVPEHALVVSVRDGERLDGLGLARVAAFPPEEKVSALAVALGPTGSGHYVVEFHPDTQAGPMREIATESGLLIREHTDLARHQLLVVAGLEQLFALAEWDEVAYIYPASPDLAEGRPVVACAGALTEFAAIGQYVAQVGKGWSGDSTGRVTLQYHFGQPSAKLTSDQVRAEIERALKEWARHARLDFVPGSSATEARTINFLFASGGHGDPYPFDGPGKTLAHTFYPSPPNPEPLAGDVHFDDDEGWRIGADTDLYSVALHELGHSLGLGHSDLPGTVMYPFYRRAETLTPEDERAIQGLYAPPDAGPPPAGPPPAEPPPAEPPPPEPPQAGPLRLAITAPETQYVTSAVTLTLAGTLSGGTAPLSLSWSSDQGPSGTAAAAGLWRIPGVPLAVGRNLISVVAVDARLQQAAQSVAVTREAAPAQPTADTVAPWLAIQSPAGTSVLVSSAVITVRGSARDNVGVAEVTWSLSSGRSGVARGTTSWVIADLPLLVGANTATIRARDAAGNVGWRSLVITCR